VLALLLAEEVLVGGVSFGYAWLLPLLAVLAYLAADLLSGFVHFLADNFGSAETPIIGPNFVGAFREHHVDPKGIPRVSPTTTLSTPTATTVLLRCPS
jgi:Lipid desaturase domain